MGWPGCLRVRATAAPPAVSAAWPRVPEPGWRPPEERRSPAIAGGTPSPEVGNQAATTATAGLCDSWLTKRSRYPPGGTVRKVPATEPACTVTWPHMPSVTASALARCWLSPVGAGFGCQVVRTGLQLLPVRRVLSIGLDVREIAAPCASLSSPGRTGRPRRDRVAWLPAGRPGLFLTLVPILRRGVRQPFTKEVAEPAGFFSRGGPPCTRRPTCSPGWALPCAGPRAVSVALLRHAVIVCIHHPAQLVARRRHGSHPG